MREQGTTASSGSSATCACTTTCRCTSRQHGPVLCLYVVEPSLWAEPDAARQHYGFMLESLRDLYRDLRQLGGQLQVVTGEVTEVLARLHRSAFGRLYSHEETGNGLTIGVTGPSSAGARRRVWPGRKCRNSA
jgi:hypothetical protein